MKLCHAMHIEVAYEEHHSGCPVCAAIQDRDMALASKDEEIEELKGSIDAYRTELGI